LNNKKNAKIFALTLLTTLFLVAIVAPMIAVNAQGQGTFVILDAVGGTTDPAPGSHSYDDGQNVEITATASDAYVFQYWIVDSDSGSSQVTDNPLTLPAVADVTYNIQPVFDPIQAPPSKTLPTDLGSAAIVVILPTSGGTTSPAPGTYAIANADNLMLTATPDSGWQFSHWVISGQDMSHGTYEFTPTPTENPYNVNHGYGNTYAYQAVFVPTGTTEPTPAGQTPTPAPGVGGLSMESIIIIGLVVVIIVILAAFGAYALRRKK
jgi:hypothetical protein